MDIANTSSSRIKIERKETKPKIKSQKTYIFKKGMKEGIVNYK
jgi:hypothetical protein